VDGLCQPRRPCEILMMMERVATYPVDEINRGQCDLGAVERDHTPGVEKHVSYARHGMNAGSGFFPWGSDGGFRLARPTWAEEP
jgi:hypothetical protein